MSSIDRFYGDSNKESDVVDELTLPQLNLWFDSAVWRLQSAAIDPTLWSSVLCQRLAGPVAKALMRKQQEDGWVASSLSASALREHLLALYEDAQVRFTDRLQGQTFSRSTLVDDIHKFRMYAEHSSHAGNLDGNRWLYKLLRDKMHKAVPQILVTAQVEYQLSLDESVSFSRYCGDAMTLVSRVQAAIAGGPSGHGGGGEAAKGKADGRVGASSSDGQKKARSASRSASPAGRLSEDELAALRDTERCFKCGFYCKSKEHRLRHTCTPGKLQARLRAVMAARSKGQDPNAPFVQAGGPRAK